MSCCIDLIAAPSVMPLDTSANGTAAVTDGAAGAAGTAGCVIFEWDDS